jgi:putative transposase
VITGSVEQRLREIVAAVLTEKEARLITIELVPRYVHLVVEVGPQLGIHRLVKAIKARSASALREEFPSLRTRLPSLWTNSYLVTTVGNPPPAALIQGFLSEQRTR